MSILKVVQYGEVPLRTCAKEVTKVSKKIHKLIKDMLDTMYSQNGVGLAAPQVGESLRVVVIDVSPSDGPADPIILINPKIIKKSGAMSSFEGCLSFPKVFMDVRRYDSVTVKAMDEKGRHFVVSSEGNNLLTKALQHELDHLDGVLFIDHARNIFEADKLLSKNGLKPVQSEKLISEPELEEKIIESGEDIEANK